MMGRDQPAAELELRATTLESALRDLDDRIAELEGEIAGHRNEVDRWQAYLDRELGGL